MANNQIETEIVTLDDNEFETLMDEKKVPNATATADDLKGAKRIAQQETTTHINVGTEEQGITELSEEEEDLLDETKAAEAKKKATEAKKKEKADEPQETAEEKEAREAKEAEDTATKKANEKKAAKGKEKEDEESPATTPEAASAYKQITAHLIETGAWKDFDGREELSDEDFDDDFFTQLVEKQDEERVSSKFNDLVEATGPVGQTIIKHVLNGGKAKDLVKLFVDNQAVQEINIKTPEGQEAVVKTYYKSLGWDESKITKQVKLLVDGNLLEEFAIDTQKLYDKDTTKKAENVVKVQEQQRIDNEKRQEDFEKSVYNKIVSRPDLSRQQKDVLAKSLLEFNIKLPNGDVVNKFYMNFAKMQSNLDDYIDLALFVEDKASFVSKIAKKEETKVAKKTWDFVKGNGAVKSTKDSKYPESGKGKNDTDLVIKYK